MINLENLGDLDLGDLDLYPTTPPPTISEFSDSGVVTLFCIVFNSSFSYCIKKPALNLIYTKLPDLTE